ncbi:hypothetical protein L345_12415, partial [Ophiophagus hannah]
MHIGSLNCGKKTPGASSINLRLHGDAGLALKDLHQALMEEAKQGDCQIYPLPAFSLLKNIPSGVAKPNVTFFTRNTETFTADRRLLSLPPLPITTHLLPTHLPPSITVAHLLPTHLAQPIRHSPFGIDRRGPFAMACSPTPIGGKQVVAIGLQQMGHSDR